MSSQISEEARVLEKFKKLDTFLINEHATLVNPPELIFHKGEKCLEYAVANNIRVNRKELHDLEVFCDTVYNRLTSQIAEAKAALGIA